MGSFKKLTAVRHHAAAAVFLKTAEKYRQLHTQTKRRLLDVRRVRFQLDTTRRCRLHSLAFAAPVNVLVAHADNFAKPRAAKTMGQKLLQTTSIGQIFSNH